MHPDAHTIFAFETYTHGLPATAFGHHPTCTCKFIVFIINPNVTPLSANPSLIPVLESCPFVPNSDVDVATRESHMGPRLFADMILFKFLSGTLISTAAVAQTTSVERDPISP